jgi:hypothetical protein
MFRRDCAALVPAPAVSRGLAEQLGGSLQLQSGLPSEGSTFVQRLPAADS